MQEKEPGEAGFEFAMLLLSRVMQVQESENEFLPPQVLPGSVRYWLDYYLDDGYQDGSIMI